VTLAEATARDAEASAELDESADFEQPQIRKLPKTAAAMAAAALPCKSILSYFSPLLFFMALFSPRGTYPDFAMTATGRHVVRRKANRREPHLNSFRPSP
jgi:hypothetical protein